MWEKSIDFKRSWQNSAKIEAICLFVVRTKRDRFSNNSTLLPAITERNQQHFMREVTQQYLEKTYVSCTDTKQPIKVV